MRWKRREVEGKMEEGGGEGKTFGMGKDGGGAKTCAVEPTKCGLHTSIGHYL